jgi:predicted methyltransferase
MNLFRTLAAGALSLGLLASAAATAEPAFITAALADKTRPQKALDLDATRKPAEVLSFAGVRPGDKVADLMPGAGYYTLLFSDIVGPKGHVYAVVPTEILKFGPRATEGITALQADHRNVSLVSPAINSFAVAEKLDMVWTSWNYHDFHDPFMGPADLGKVNKAIFDALKPGGVYLILDHAAQAGSGMRDTNTLHRIDMETVKAEVTAAGFVLDGISAALSNPEDAHSLNVFDGKIRGHTDTFVLKFRKPKR